MSLAEKYPRDFKDLHLTVASREQVPLLEKSFLTWLNEESLPFEKADYNYKQFKEDVKIFLQSCESDFPDMEKHSLNNRESKRLLALVELYNKVRHLPVGIEVLSELEDLLGELSEFKLMHPDDISPLAERLLSEVSFAVVESLFTEFAREVEDKVLDKSAYQIYLEKIRNLFPDKQKKIDELDDKIKLFLKS